MWITPKPFGAADVLAFWGCGKAWDARGIFWGKRHFGRACVRILAARRGAWLRPFGFCAGRRPKSGGFGRPKSGYPHYPQKRFPQKVEKKAQCLPWFWRRAHKLSTRLSTDPDARPGACAPPQNPTQKAGKVYPTIVYHTLADGANKSAAWVRGRGGRDEGTKGYVSFLSQERNKEPVCDVKVN